MAKRGHLHTRHKPKDVLDYVVYVFMFITPLFELPRVISIYATKRVEGVSIWTWSFFFMANIVWILYAIKHKLTPLIVMYSIFLVLEGSIVVGILTYANRN